MTTLSTGDGDQPAVFTPQADTAVVATDFSRVLKPGDEESTGWLARRDLIPLGYLGDAAKTAKTFPTIDGVRWSVPGDKARYLDDGRIELLGRDSVTINSGGEKIFAEEVERAIAAPPAHLRRRRGGPALGALGQRGGGDRAVRRGQVGQRRRSASTSASAASPATRCRRLFIRTDKVMRSPAGKADYRWAKDVAANSLG